MLLQGRETPPPLQIVRLLIYQVTRKIKKFIYLSISFCLTLLFLELFGMY